MQHIVSIGFNIYFPSSWCHFPSNFLFFFLENGCEVSFDWQYSQIFCHINSTVETGKVKIRRRQVRKIRWFHDRFPFEILRFWKRSFAILAGGKWYLFDLPKSAVSLERTSPQKVKGSRITDSKSLSNLLSSVPCLTI